MNSTRHFRCFWCGEKFAVLMLAYDEWNRRCPKCHSRWVKKQFDYNPNDPRDQAAHPEFNQPGARI